MTTINLTQDQIKKLRTRRDGVKATYHPRDEMFTRFEEIYFMKGTERPKDAAIDKKDWKVTVSPGGRDKVTGLKRILDTSEIHIKVKEKPFSKNQHPNSDKIEAALKEMLRISGEYKPARIERDTNLAAVLYGPVVLACNSIDDMLETKRSYSDPVSMYVRKQLGTIRRRTPFLIETINPKESYPVFGRFGMVGHLQEYTLTGAEIKEEWGCEPEQFMDATDYKVQDFFYYSQRLVESSGKTLYAGEWLTRKTDPDTGEDTPEYDGVTNVPVFVRIAGGTTLFHKPEEMLNSFLYGYAKGEWDKRENLFWTYLFTAIYSQGLPGPTIVKDPDDANEVTVSYKGGVRVIEAKGKLENVQVINGDVLNMKNLMDEQTGKSTIQEQTIGGGSDAATFSAYVMSVNAGKLPAIDPKEAQEQAYRDLFIHILQRIKYEGIENTLISPDDIPDDIELDVTLEPNLQQDDLRNSQIVTQLKASGANVSDEWLNTNLLKIPDSEAMFRQKTKEEVRKAVIANILQTPEMMQQFIMVAMGMDPQPQQPPQQPPTGPQIPPGMEEQMSQMPGQMPGAGMETMPQTDAMIPINERI